MWTGTDTRLVVTAVLVVALVIVLITTRLRLHAFPALMVGSLVLGLAAGLAVFFSHVNDAGFWLVREYFGMTVRDTFRTWSVMETLVSVVGLLAVLAASLVV